VLPNFNYYRCEIMDSSHVPAAVGIVGMLGTFTLAEINSLVGIAVGVASLCYLLLRIIKEWRNK
jgi:hypothetical protein